MPRHVPVSIALLSSLLITTSVSAQQRGRAPAPVTQQASAAGGHIRGIVRDDIGSAVGGVMVVAMGTTNASAKSDSTGRYSLTLPPGEYILRAARDGYVSTFREPVRMQTSVELERNITIVRQGAITRPAMLAGVGDFPSLIQLPASTSSTESSGTNDTSPSMNGTRGISEKPWTKSWPDMPARSNDEGLTVKLPRNG